VRELYHWAEEIHDKEWNYCINRTDDQKNHVQRKGERYKGKEIFILNYESKSPLGLDLNSTLNYLKQLRFNASNR
jgi:DNA adenine methylase